MNRFALILLLISANALMGCSGNDAPQMAVVKGNVTWKGKPLADAGVTFTPEKGPVATGRTDEAGQFSLSTRGSAGAVLGSHRVTIQAFEPIPDKMKSVSPDDQQVIPRVSRIPEKFGHLKKSGLQADVTETENEINFDLSSQ